MNVTGTYITDIPQWEFITEIPTAVAIAWIRSSVPWKDLDEFIDLNVENFQRRLLDKSYWKVASTEWIYIAVYLYDGVFQLYKWVD